MDVRTKYREIVLCKIYFVMYCFALLKKIDILNNKKQTKNFYFNCKIKEMAVFFGEDCETGTNLKEQI